MLMVDFCRQDDCGPHLGDLGSRESAHNHVARLQCWRASSSSKRATEAAVAWRMSSSLQESDHSIVRPSASSTTWFTQWRNLSTSACGNDRTLLMRASSDIVRTTSNYTAASNRNPHAPQAVTDCLAIVKPPRLGQARRTWRPVDLDALGR